MKDDQMVRGGDKRRWKCVKTVRLMAGRAGCPTKTPSAAQDSSLHLVSYHCRSSGRLGCTLRMWLCVSCLHGSVIRI